MQTGKRITARRQRQLEPSRDSRGQSLVEFSLMMIFLLVLVMGVLDLGRAYFTYLALKDAAAEGAYFGSAYPQCTQMGGAYGGQPACTEVNSIVYRVEHSAVQGGLIDWDSATIATTLPATLQAGSVLTVSISYPYTMLTPFVGAVANGQTLTLTASSAATIIRVPDCHLASGCN